MLPVLSRRACPIVLLMILVGAVAVLAIAGRSTALGASASISFNKLRLNFLISINSSKGLPAKMPFSLRKESIISSGDNFTSDSIPSEILHIDQFFI